MLERMRWRLTMGYASIFALILLLLATAAVVGFSRELTNQQDTLLTQEAKDVEKNLLDGDHREVLAEGSGEYSWVALDLEGHVTDRDPSAATLGTLGLPSKALARQTLEEDEGVSATIHGPQGRVRVVSMPMREESGKVVGSSSMPVLSRECIRRSAGSSCCCSPWGSVASGQLSSAVSTWPVGPYVRRVNPSRSSVPSSLTPPTSSRHPSLLSGRTP